MKRWGNTPGLDLHIYPNRNHPWNTVKTRFPDAEWNSDGACTAPIQSNKITLFTEDHVREEKKFTTIILGVDWAFAQRFVTSLVSLHISTTGNPANIAMAINASARSLENFYMELMPGEGQMFPSEFLIIGDALQQ
eukprot:1545587-Rhodomonas_salina.1